MLVVQPYSVLFPVSRALCLVNKVRNSSPVEVVYWKFLKGLVLSMLHSSNRGTFCTLNLSMMHRVSNFRNMWSKVGFFQSPEFKTVMNLPNSFMWLESRIFSTPLLLIRRSEFFLFVVSFVSLKHHNFRLSRSLCIQHEGQNVLESPALELV